MSFLNSIKKTLLFLVEVTEPGNVRYSAILRPSLFILATFRLLSGFANAARPLYQEVVLDKTYQLPESHHTKCRPPKSCFCILRVQEILSLCACLDHFPELSFQIMGVCRILLRKVLTMDLHKFFFSLHFP